ncbi:MAG: cell envelope integrity EipB family protein [Hyphomicrobiales bacterium]
MTDRLSARPRVALLLSLPMAVCLWAGPARADAAALVPHRAVYDLSLKSAQDKSGITSAQGRMVIEVKGGTCEGWTVDFRMVNQFTTEGGTSKLLDVRSSSFETLDGKEMRYNERQFVDNALEEETVLSAKQGESGKPGAGKIEKPDPATFEVPPGAVFAVSHQLRLVEMARKGETRDQSIVFDGSDNDKSMEVISFFGPKEKAPANDALKAVNGMDVWPVSVSYYSLDKGQTSDTPEYQVQMKLYDNGVSGDLTLDYGEFALDAHLTRLDLLDPTKCP